MEAACAILMDAGRNAEAISVAERRLDLDPGSPLCLERAAFARLLEHGLDSGRPVLSAAAKASGRTPGRLEDEVAAALEGKGDRKEIARRLAADPCA